MDDGNPYERCGDLIYDTVDDPQFVHELLHFTTEYVKMLGEAIAETEGYFLQMPQLAVA